MKVEERKILGGTVLLLLLFLASLMIFFYPAPNSLAIKLFMSISAFCFMSIFPISIMVHYFNELVKRKRLEKVIS